MKLERVNDECHCCIGQLLSEAPAYNECDFMSTSNSNYSMKDINSGLMSNEKVTDKKFRGSFDALRRGFLLGSTKEDRRKKLHNNTNISSKSSTDEVTRM